MVFQFFVHLPAHGPTVIGGRAEGPAGRRPHDADSPWGSGLRTLKTPST
jgi:hypothetical protein